MNRADTRSGNGDVSNAFEFCVQLPGASVASTPGTRESGRLHTFALLKLKLNAEARGSPGEKLGEPHSSHKPDKKMVAGTVHETFATKVYKETRIFESFY